MISNPTILVKNTQHDPLENVELANDGWYVRYLLEQTGELPELPRRHRHTVNIC